MNPVVSRLALPGLLALTVAAYVPSLSAPFVFDDLPQLVENPLIRDLDHFLEPERVATAGANDLQIYAYRSRWLAMASFALNHRVHGLDVLGYHVVNLAIHLLAGLTLYRLVRLTLDLPSLRSSKLAGRERAVALFTAAAFLVHPVQTQAVTYVVQRMASLAGLLCLLALVAYVEARVRRGPLRWGYYLASLVTLVAAMKTKENAATFPLLVLLYELLFFTGPIRGRLRWLVPHLSTVAIVPWSVAGGASGGWLDRAVASSRVETEVSRLDYLLTQLRVVVTYLRLVVWPARQNLDYDYATYPELGLAPVLLSLVLLAALAGLALALLARSRRGEPGWRLVGYGILWFFLALSVESSVVPIADVIFEHRVYLPSAGILLAVVASLFLLTPSVYLRRTVVALVLVVIALATATALRNRVWRSPLTLWTDVVAKSPGKARPHFNRGDYLRQAGRLREAVVEWETAVSIDPTQSEALNALGNVALLRDEPEQAYERYRQAVAARPDNAEARYNLAAVADRLGRTEEAMEHYRAFVAIAGPRFGSQVEAARARLAGTPAAAER